MQAASDMVYTRSNPSPRYQALIAQYQQMHLDGVPDHGLSAAHTFPGQSLLEHVGPLLELFDEYQFRSMLDYGCGKGMLYRPNNQITLPNGDVFSCLQQLFNIPIHLYDPAYMPYAQRPFEASDLVVCTDVLEHCSEEDVGWILADLFDYSNVFVYANIACYPASKSLPNGENAHCTVRDAQWWADLIHQVAQSFPGIDYRFVCTLPDGSQSVIQN